jgi:hypothetical protein
VGELDCSDAIVVGGWFGRGYVFEISMGVLDEEAERAGT